MRTRSPLRSGIVALALALPIALAVATDARAQQCGEDGPPWDTSIWFMPFNPGNSPYPFGNPLGWRRFLWPVTFCDANVLPVLGEATYISRETTAVVASGDLLYAGQIYVGGWDSTYDNSVVGGSSEDDSGTLRITGGSLTGSGCTIPRPCNPEVEQCPPPNTQECYLRVGYRGAEGTIEQSGGTLQVATILSIGMGSATSHGVYQLSGGLLKAGGIDVGVQGTGEFHMTGGEYQSTCCGTNVGRGYEYGGQIGTGLIPAYGLYTQSGGKASFGVAFTLGVEEGSFGEVQLSGAADFSTPSIRGGNGDAAIVQTGGTAKVPWHVMLGEKPGSSASYEISGGSLVQQICCGSSVPLEPNGSPVLKGLYVGYEGHGEFTVVGKDASIEIGGIYRQNSGSRLTVEIAPDAPHLSPIEVAGVATFEEGAQLRVELRDGYVPPAGTIFTVLTAQAVEGPLVELVDPEGLWIAAYDGSPANALKVAYWPDPSCGLTGLEAVVLLLLARAARRRRARALEGQPSGRSSRAS